MSVDQWLRDISLVVAPQVAVPPNAPLFPDMTLEEFNKFRQGENLGIDLSQLRIRFTIEQNDFETPNAARIRVYNLSDTTAKRVQNEFVRVILQAGYKGGGNFGVIFDGNIKQVYRGRESQTDKYLDILAADGDIFYNGAIINQTLAAGATPKDQLTALATVAASNGSMVRYAPDVTLAPPALPRGKVLYGMWRTPMSNLAKSQNWTWSTQNGQVVITPQSSYLPGEAVVINSDTGMIGLPQQTENGIEVRILLNPRIRIGTRVQINNESIQVAPISLQFTAINAPARIADDGFYYVMVAEHSGDTRGNEWYTDLTCLAIDPSAPVSESVQGG